jgi:hypothetical protein
VASADDEAVFPDHYQTRPEMEVRGVLANLLGLALSQIPREEWPALRARAILACTVLAVALAASATTSVSADPGFKTAQSPMLTAVKAGVTVEALLTVGEDVPGTDYRFEAIPDGISVHIGEDDRIELFVNHETSKVPFPFNPNTPSDVNGESDFDNSQVSHLVLDSRGGLLSGEFAIDSSQGFQRFCSNYLATSKEGFTKDILFTNEESPDYVFRREDSWPPPLSNAGAEENGVVLALDVATGDFHPIYGMGRHNHENDVAIPGFDKLVVMSGDDTFTSGPLSDPLDTTAPIRQLAPSQSQLYSYLAGNTNTLLADKGDLWAFTLDDPSLDDYYDFTPGSTATASGRFIKVPKTIATGKSPDGSEVKAADFGYPLPPNDGSWQRDLRDTFGIGDPQIGIDGPQWVLEYWSQLHNVFDFVRVEDLAYDKRPGMGNVVYVVDSGRGRRPTDGLDTPFRSTNGRVWKMVLDPANPRKVTSFGLFVEGDDNPVKTVDELHQPDNIETTPTGILVTEDPGSSQQFTAADQINDAARATTARLWYVPYSGQAGKEIVAKVDQSADGGPTDVGPEPTLNPSIGNWGAWESSGIVDASAAFGEGSYLIDVQAHTLWVDKAPGPDTFIGTDVVPDDPDFTFKREGGQLLLIHIPGV